MEKNKNKTSRHFNIDSVLHICVYGLAMLDTSQLFSATMCVYAKISKVPKFLAKGKKIFLV